MIENNDSTFESYIKQHYYDFKCLINEKRVHFNQHSTEWHAHVRPYNKSSGKQGNVLKPQQSY